MPTLTLQQNPPMCCTSGRRTKSLPRFTKYDAEVPPSREKIEDFLYEHDGDEIQLLNHNTNVTWHVIRTLASRERQLAHMLLQMRLSYFLPMVKVRAQAANKRFVTQRLVFPGFIFVLFRPEDRNRVLATRRVASILTVDGNHAQKHLQKELLTIKRACMLHNKQQPDFRFAHHRTVIELRKGQKARFIEGHPLHGSEVTVTNTLPNGKVEVESPVAMLGASVFETHSDHLEIIDGL